MTGNAGRRSAFLRECTIDPKEVSDSQPNLDEAHFPEVCWKVCLLKGLYAMGDIAPSPPARLYAMLLKLRPREAGTIMPFSGELVHGAWLKWIRAVAPDVSDMLHEGNKRRLFTCSSLQFPLPRARMLEAERQNTHMPVHPEKTYTIRITMLLSKLFPLLYHTLMRGTGGNFSSEIATMRIGKREFLLEEVICTPGDSGSWTGFTSIADLVACARARDMGSQFSLTLEFASLTAFHWIDATDKTYGSHYARLPLPKYIFPGLARRWQEIAPPDLASLIQKERLERYIEADGIIIEDYDLRPHEVHFVRHPQRGFLGKCTYQLRGPDEPTLPEAPLSVRQQIFLLALLSFYTGIGYKTPMGMGQVRPLL
jgi:CRISPR-associated endoribonuclease Cas6